MEPTKYGIACKHPDDSARLIVKRVDGTHYEMLFSSTHAATKWGTEDYDLIRWNRFDFPFIKRIKKTVEPMFFIHKRTCAKRLIQRMPFNQH